METFEGREVTPTGWVIFYDEEATAELLAERLKATMKTAHLKGNPYFSTFSIVRLSSWS